MTGVDDDRCLWAKGQAVDQGGAPVGHIHRVEGRLEQLVLEQKSLVIAEPGVDLGQCDGQALLPFQGVVLTGVVGAVGEPQLEIPGARCVHDVDALQQMIGRFATHPGIGVGDRTQHVVVVLEDVAVDRTDAHAEAVGMFGEMGEVIDPVPGDVQRNAGRNAGEGVHLGGVGNLLVRISRDATLGEHLEAGARVAECP